MVRIRHSKRLARQFRANTGPEARTRVAFSKGSGWTVMDMGGEPG